MGLIQQQRHILKPGDTANETWLEVQDWRVSRSDKESVIEIVAKREGPPAVGEEDITVWLTVNEASKLAGLLDELLNRQGMVIDYES